MKLDFSKLFVVLLVILLINESFQKLPTVKKKKDKKDKEKNVQQKGLVKSSISYNSILKENENYSQKDLHLNHFKGDTLGYITPWYNHGYDVAKTFNGKFTYIAPVWYRFTYELELLGGHDVDLGWMEDVRTNNNPKNKRFTAPKIVPRFHFETYSQESLVTLFTEEELVVLVIETIVEEVIKNNFDGIVLDFGFLPFNVLGENLVFFFKTLSDEFVKLGNKEIILVVPPTISTNPDEQFFTSKEFLILEPFVNKFHVMTYDYIKYAKTQTDIGNSPLHFISSSILKILPPAERSSKASKIMMGINFFGYDFSMNEQNVIINNQYLDLLKEHRPTFSWQESTDEHVFYYPKDGMQHMVMYPSLLYIQKRLELAADFGVSLAIWECGQGLDYFYDLL